MGACIKNDMRTLNRNKRILHYANQTGARLPIYELKPDGTYMTIMVDGVETKVISGYEENPYSLPVEFEGNLSLSGGEISNVEFGIDASAYDAILVINKGDAQISETSLIWADSEIAYKDIEETIVDPNSADYRVTRVSPSLNESKYLLAKVVK